MSNDFEITFERKLESRADGHRRISAEDKARILAESFKPGVTVAEVARRNGLSAQRLYSWRNQARAAFKTDGDGNGSTATAALPGTISEQER